ncbi:MAG: hypothetical protein ACOX2W_00965 [Desulfomonilia bacterium]
MKKISVFLFAGCLIFVLSAPVLAENNVLEDRVSALEKIIGNWSFYGKAQLSTFYTDESSRDASGNDTSDKSLRWDSQCNARVGANWKHENLSANVELGLDNDSREQGGTGVRTRTIFGTYDFGAGSITIGQDWTPLNSIVYSNQVVLDDLDLIGYGTIWEEWSPQIKFRTRGFEIALIEEDGSADISGADEYDVDVLMPKIEAAYHFVGDNYFADVFGGFFSYKIEDVTVGNVNYGNETVNCWALGVGGGINIDPAYIKASVYMARNEINLGLIHADASGAKINATGDLVNEDSLGALLVAGAKIDKYTVEAGVGYVTAEYDESGSEKNDAISAYINATIPIYGSFFIVPEVGMFDYLDGSDGEDEHRDSVYFGAKWQIDF